MKIEFRHEPLTQLTTSALVAYNFEGAPASSGTVERLPAETRTQLAATANSRRAHRESHLNAQFSGGQLEWQHRSCWWWVPARAKNSARRTSAIWRERRYGICERAGCGNWPGFSAPHERRRDNGGRGWRSAWPIMTRILIGPSATARRELTIFGWRRAVMHCRPEAEAALNRGRILGEAQNFTRELVNEPSNHMTPTKLADRASRDGLALRPGV